MEPLNESRRNDAGWRYYLHRIGRKGRKIRRIKWNEVKYRKEISRMIRKYFERT